VSKVGENEINIEWKPPTKDGGSRVKKYHIYIKSESTEDKWINVEAIDAFKTYFTISKLNAKNKYYIGVSAENDVGKGDMATVDKTYSPKQPISKFVTITYLPKQPISKFVTITYSPKQPISKFVTITYSPTHSISLLVTIIILLTNTTNHYFVTTLSLQLAKTPNSQL